MNKTTQNIIISVILLAVGILAVIFRIFVTPLCVTVGMLGIIYALVMGLTYRVLNRSPRTLALAIAAVVSAVAGVTLLIDVMWGFFDPKYLVLAVLVSSGIITLGLGLQLRDNRFKIWLNVTIAGGGAVVAGLLSLIYVEVALLVGCVTADVILILPLIKKAVTSNRDARGNKIVTVKEKDIEIIEDEDNEKK